MLYKNNVNILIFTVNLYCVLSGLTCHNWLRKNCDVKIISGHSVTTIKQKFIHSRHTDIWITSNPHVYASNNHTHSVCALSLVPVMLVQQVIR